VAVKNVLFVHGYSETSLGAYSAFPLLLSRVGIKVDLLSAFDSLDDQVSIGDLAAALEDHVRQLEADPAHDWQTERSAIRILSNVGAPRTRFYEGSRCVHRPRPRGEMSKVFRPPTPTNAPKTS
jgi:hypothetical protein